MLCDNEPCYAETKTKTMQCEICQFAICHALRKITPATPQS